MERNEIFRGEGDKMQNKFRRRQPRDREMVRERTDGRVFGTRVDYGKRWRAAADHQKVRTVLTMRLLRICRTRSASLLFSTGFRMA